MTDKISKINEDHEFVRDLGIFIVGVDKIGGGTVGKSYDGDWSVVLYSLQGNRVESVPVRTGIPKSHQYVAAMVYEDLAGEW